MYVLLPSDQVMYTRLLWTKTVLFMTIKRQEGDRILFKKRLKGPQKWLYFLVYCLFCEPLQYSENPQMVFHRYLRKITENGVRQKPEPYKSIWVFLF